MSRLYLTFRFLKFKWQYAFLLRVVGGNFALRLLERVPKQLALKCLRFCGASIGEGCDLEPPFYFHNCVDLKNLQIGTKSHVGKGCFFDLRDRIIIGNQVVISMQCTFLTHQDCNLSMLRAVFPASQGPLKIEDHAYLGAKSMVLQGITIGKGAVLGAGAVATKSIDSFSVWAGIPAKNIKSIDIEGFKPETGE